MRQLYYTILTLLRGRGSNVIKTISLTLGFFIGVILFARIAFDLSFDSHYDGIERIYKVDSYFCREGQEPAWDWLYGPVIDALVEGLPDEVESGTTCKPFGVGQMFYENRRMQPECMLADATYFATMGIEVLSGDPEELTNPDVVFVSRKFAEENLGKESPVGKILMYGKSMPVTIKGVYKEIPENSSMHPDVIISIATVLKAEMFYWGWNGGSAYAGYLRLKKGVDPRHLEANINKVLSQYVNTDVSKGFALKFETNPLKSYHSEKEDVRRMRQILLILAFSVLMIASMNYILISISSLYKRAKAIGVHKCSGATNSNIFSMFLWETVFILGVSCIFTFVLMLTFRGVIEELADTSLGALFNLNTLWVPLTTLLLLFFMAGILPGRVFSKVPVSQVFRRYTEGKNSWKRPLLFIQFAGISFILGLLAVVFIQYNHAVNRDVGYDTESLVFAYDDQFADPELVKNTLKSLPMIESVSTSCMNLLGNYSGEQVQDEQTQQYFTTRWNEVDLHYVSVTGLKLVEGRDIQAKEELLVNEEFVRRKRWSGSPIGQGVYIGRNYAGTVVGVLKDFPTGGIYSTIEPMVLFPGDDCNDVYNIRLKQPYEENLKALNEQVEQMFPTNDLVFKSYKKALENKYRSIRHFRDSVIAATISIILIALMGLFGYINDEIRRRGKEIAIRKVNGAEAGDILTLFSRNIFRIAFLSVVLGTVLSYFMGQKWMEQFKEQTPVSLLIYVVLMLVINLLIHLAVILKSWRIANENPINSIKSE